ncbi:MAG: hypothetical protein U1F76_11005 [Candidatus Competibacteraceae bacterium]
MLNGPCLIVGILIGLTFGGVLCVVFYQRGQKRGEDATFDRIKWEIIPICRTEVGVLFWKSVTVRYGYQFQLYFRGVPAIKSEETIIGTKTLTEVNQQQLLDFTREAVKVALSAKIGGFADFAGQLLSQPTVKELKKPIN